VKAQFTAELWYVTAQLTVCCLDQNSNNTTQKMPNLSCLLLSREHYLQVFVTVKH